MGRISLAASVETPKAVPKDVLPPLKDVVFLPFSKSELPKHLKPCSAARPCGRPLKPLSDLRAVSNGRKAEAPSFYWFGDDKKPSKFEALEFSHIPSVKLSHPMNVCISYAF